MWVAKTDAEANFIFDLLADPDASGPALAYARWLEHGGEFCAAEFLRLGLSWHENREGLQQLREQLDARWLATVTSRWIRPGDVVRITGGVFQGIKGTAREVDAARGCAGLLLHLFYCPREPTWVDFTDLVLQKRARPEDRPE